MFEWLVQIDATILSSDRPPLPPMERRAILLAQAVNPGEGRGFDWLVPESTNTAKFIHHEHVSDFTVFVFDDRSVLVVLGTGFFYAVANGDSLSVATISDWLTSHLSTTSHALH
ncbi:hypothetical protein [Pseudomonas mosselii]|uniref:hypothetical protein n=1 Tax=Pseudomonas mosselii TaxID=78327 RepID=UPI0021D85D9A|nr:hypothetical protein [Pseudomonas mosselii]MCU9527475.1 hypothetical protein [Pseudomonas mosselii]MCU9534788.1 hypothetical protein [Pseudomonas mosselii]MCU9542722.1 hypothetical protein [Pseudomonas mosselii]MCU9546628.1 hypothetical protein [Pseudomonas mosselii]